jgi:hypothetical protein
MKTNWKQIDTSYLYDRNEIFCSEKIFCNKAIFIISIHQSTNYGGEIKYYYNISFFKKNNHLIEKWSNCDAPFDGPYNLKFLNNTNLLNVAQGILKQIKTIRRAKIKKMSKILEIVL